MPPGEYSTSRIGITHQTEPKIKELLTCLSTVA